MYMHTGNTTFAAICGSENFDNLEVALGSVFDDINDLLRSPTLDVNGTRYKLEFFLGGDYKVTARTVNFSATLKQNSFHISRSSCC